MDPAPPEQAARQIGVSVGFEIIGQAVEARRIDACPEVHWTGIDIERWLRVVIGEVGKALPECLIERLLEGLPGQAHGLPEQALDLGIQSYRCPHAVTMRRNFICCQDVNLLPSSLHFAPAPKTLR